MGDKPILWEWGRIPPLEETLPYIIFKYIIVNLDYKILKVDLARGMKWYSIARGTAMNRYSINIFNKCG